MSASVLKLAVATALTVCSLFFLGCTQTMPLLLIKPCGQLCIILGKNCNHGGYRGYRQSVQWLLLALALRQTLVQGPAKYLSTRVENVTYDACTL